MKDLNVKRYVLAILYMMLIAFLNWIGLLTSREMWIAVFSAGLYGILNDCIREASG